MSQSMPWIGVLLLAALPAWGAEIDYRWEDRFSAAERARLTAWIDGTAAALEALVGGFPMDVRVHFHRRDGAREPVPWANTQRFRGQGVHFHVDPDYDLAAFRSDWTAPHELSHLILPYLGRRHAWFAEGFASFMQYRVMQAMGVMSASEAERRYRRNLERAEDGYPYASQPFAAAAPRLRAERRYRVMYWGGAAYFLQVSEALDEHGTSLPALLRDYMRCCRRDRADLDALLEALDRLTGSDVFRTTMTRFNTQPGFPAYRSLLGDAAGE